MSQAGLDVASIVATFGSIAIDNDCGMAGLALLVYEYSITFAREVDLFWKRKLNGAAVLFLANRYTVLVTMFLNVSGAVVTVRSPQSCSLLAKVTNIFALLQYVPWAMFSGMRAFALSSKNIPFTILIFALSFTPVAANLMNFVFGLNGVEDPIFGCVVIDPINPGLAKNLTIASRTCLMASDVFLIIITWMTVSRAVKIRSLAIENAATFATVLLRDGAIYFVVLLILNALHLTLSILSVEVAFQNASYVIQFVHPITGILVSRFLLDLQSADRRALDLESDSRVTQDDTIIFAQAPHRLIRRVALDIDEDDQGEADDKFITSISSQWESA